MMTTFVTYIKFIKKCYGNYVTTEILMLNEDQRQKHREQNK